VDQAKDDVLAYMAFHPDHWSKISSTKPLERLNGEIERRIEVVGIFPTYSAIVWLVGAPLREQNKK
jgi:putative transposase